ncbi:MAG: cupin domain-containing protein [Candidatus Eremiobacteraeota bacterium]|nr:cupin domain-containing protein [Candidatus Eremiobacteraeota bacterium]
MRGFRFLFFGLAIAAVAFAAGLGVGRAQTMTVGWATPTVIHVAQMTSADFPPKAPTATNQVKMLAVADGGTVQVQMGPVGKHYHANANEVQYVVSGNGMFWLGDKQVAVGPGDLIIIPKGTAHGMLADYKAVGIKSPPQAPDDVHPLP